MRKGKLYKSLEPSSDTVTLKKNKHQINLLQHKKCYLLSKITTTINQSENHYLYFSGSTGGYFGGSTHQSVFILTSTFGWIPILVQVIMAAVLECDMKYLCSFQPICFCLRWLSKHWESCVNNPNNVISVSVLSVCTSQKVEIWILSWLATLVVQKSITGTSERIRNIKPRVVVIGVEVRAGKREREAHIHNSIYNIYFFRWALGTTLKIIIIIIWYRKYFNIA